MKKHGVLFQKENVEFATLKRDLQNVCEPLVDKTTRKKFEVFHSPLTF